MAEILLGNIRGKVTVNGISADKNGNITLKADNIAAKSITVGTDIKPNDNLDSYLTVGNYACHLTATAATLTNCPSVGAFTMVVGYAVGTPSYLYQEVTHFSTGTKYYRMYSAAEKVWSEWRTTYNTFNKPTPTEIGAAPAYTYGTADLTAGTSQLETGKLYFVYE